MEERPFLPLEQHLLLCRLAHLGHVGSVWECQVVGKTTLEVVMGEEWVDGAAEAAGGLVEAGEGCVVGAEAFDEIFGGLQLQLEAVPEEPVGPFSHVKKGPIHHHRHCHHHHHPRHHHCYQLENKLLPLQNG